MNLSQNSHTYLDTSIEKLDRCEIVRTKYGYGYVMLY